MGKKGPGVCAVRSSSNTSVVEDLSAGMEDRPRLPNTLAPLLLIFRFCTSPILLLNCSHHSHPPLPSTPFRFPGSFLARVRAGMVFATWLHKINAQHTNWHRRCVPS